MRTGKTAGKQSGEEDEGVTQSIAHRVFMPSLEHGVSGWDRVGARRGDSDRLARSKDRDTGAHLRCGGK